MAFFNIFFSLTALDLNFMWEFLKVRVQFRAHIMFLRCKKTKFNFHVKLRSRNETEKSNFHVKRSKNRVMKTHTL